MNHQMVSIYIAGAQHNVTKCLTMEGPGIGRGEKKKRKRSEAAWLRSWEAKQRKRRKRLRTYGCS